MDNIFDELTRVNEDNIGWVRKLTGRAKDIPVQYLEKTPTKLTVRIGQKTYVITRTSDIQNPRTKQFSYLWTARTDKGQSMGIEHSDINDVIKALKARG
jgi:hypothetical protein